MAEESARTEWRQMGARSEHEALGIFVHDVHRRWGSVRVLAVVGARHPQPPARHREAERRDPPPRPAARVRARASGGGRDGAVRGRGCTPAFCVGCAPRRACERRAAAAGWQVDLAAAKFARLWIKTGLSCLKSSSAGTALPRESRDVGGEGYPCSLAVRWAWRQWRRICCSSRRS